MISVANVSMRYGSKILFDDVTTAFQVGRRYGLTGPNGAGKSTFMKLLTGELPPQKGTVSRPAKLGVLRQDQFAFDAFRVLDTVVMGNARLWAALEERDRLYAKPDMTDEDGMRLGELEGIVGEEDGYTAESEAAILLQGLDIPEALHEKKMSELQGGQKVRVLLAQALFGHPQALLLDEPTNHLDLDSIHWLQDFLVRYDGTLIVISHDRHFLNGVCTHTADIDYQTIITYTGGYDDMVMAKTQIRSRVESDNAQREKKIAQLNDFIARFSAGTRSSQVQSRRKEVERLQTTELARSNIQRPYIKFTMARPSGRFAIEFADITKGFGGTPVIDGFSGIVNRTLHGTGDPTSTPWLRAANVFEDIALAGMWIALILAFALVWKRRGKFIEITAILFAAFTATLGRFDLWSSAYATGRTMSPLLILLALLAFQKRRLLYAVPLLFFVPRIALQYEAEMRTMLRGMR